MEIYPLISNQNLVFQGNMDYGLVFIKKEEKAMPTPHLALHLKPGKKRLSPLARALPGKKWPIICKGGREKLTQINPYITFHIHEEVMTSPQQKSANKMKSHLCRKRVSQNHFMLIMQLSKKCCIYQTLYILCFYQINSRLQILHY